MMSDPALYTLFSGMIITFVLLGPSGDTTRDKLVFSWDSRFLDRCLCVHKFIVFWLELTADAQIYRGADFMADIIRHLADVWPRVIAGHIHYSETGISIAKLNRSTGCDHRAAIHPCK